MNFLAEKHLIIWMVLLFSSIIVFSQESTNSNFQIDPELGFSTGPAIGEKVPAFNLPDQSGEQKSLKDLIGKKGAVIDFHRSAEW